MTISTGWMDGVEARPVGWSNTGAPAVPDLTMYPKQIVNHIMQGYQQTMLGWADERPPVYPYFAHFSIGRGGRIVQHHSIWDPARHVGWGDWNLHSIGIEHEGFSVDPVAYGYDYLYGPARPWPTAMVEASIRVHKWLFEAIRTYDTTVIPDLTTVIGHKDTGQPDRVNDPGAQWYSQVRPLVLAALAPIPPEPPHEDHDLLYRRAWADGYDEARGRAIAAANAIDPAQHP